MKLPNELISKNPLFNKKEQRLIWNALLTKINLTAKRSSVVELKLRKFGTIHTHRNHKKMGKLKYLRRFNKMKWAKDKAVKSESIEFLLW